MRGWATSFWQDLRFSTRRLTKNPGFTLMTLMVLAVAIGANTAMFSLLDAVVLRSLPVAAPHQLVLIEGHYQNNSSLISYPMYRDLEKLQQVFTSVAASRDYYAIPLRVRVQGWNAAEAVRGGAVSGNYFSTLGLVPVQGRFIVPADDEPGSAASVAVVSYDFWQRALGRSPSAVGQSVTINEEPFTVIGVAPKRFTGISIGSSLEVWVPLTKFRSARELAGRRGTFFKLFGRLKPGVTVAQAQTAMTLLFQQLRAAEPQPDGGGLALPPEPQRYWIGLPSGDKGFRFFRDTLSRTLTVLMAMGALLLAILCLNLATLLSARATARQHEIAVRQALGASLRRLVRQILLENVTLAVLGGLAGLAFAFWTSRVLLGFVSTEIALHSGFTRYVPVGLDFTLDMRVLMFTQAVALLTGVLVSLAPVLVTRRHDLISLVKERTVITPGFMIGGMRLPVGKILVVSQVAISIVLLVGAGLTVRTVFNLQSLDPGFDPTNVLLIDFDVTGTGRDGAQLLSFERMLHNRLNTLPGVRSASLSWISLFSDSDLRWGVVAPGAPLAAAGVSARVDAVSAGYFETIGMTLLAGRTFTTHDNESAPLVAVVNESFARRFFPQHNPIGKRFSLGRLPNPEPAKEIVGVVKDAKYNDLREDAREMVYAPLLQTPVAPARSIQIRAIGAPQALVSQAREVLREADANIVVTDVKTLTEQVDRTLVREQLLATLSGFFGGCALLLASIGLYSVLAFQVVQRTREVGVRIALGSGRANVIWLVARDALLLVVLGVVVGVPAALATSRSVDKLLFGLTAADPLTLTLAVIVLLGVAGLASYLPARRAASVDPIVVLRSE
jgi:predicted permease